MPHIIFCLRQLPLLLLASTALLTAKPALANCPGYGRPIEAVNQEVLQRWNSIKDDRSYFFGQSILDTIEGSRLILTSAFDRFTGPEKQQVLGTLQLDGSSYEVYTADGRLLSSQYDGCTFRQPLLTERDRYGWYFNRSPVGYDLPLSERSEALRNAGQPSWRNVTVSISAQQERQIRSQFWQSVGYSRYDQGWWIGWVPEGGYFEITVANADGLTLANSFIDQALQDYRYVVVARDGTPLRDTRYSRGNPWQWLLCEAALPKDWQVQVCEPTQPFLCVTKQGQRIGTVEVQRWDLEQLPDLQGEFSKRGLVPGLLIYDNPSDRAKVLAALNANIIDYYQTIRADRLATYGTRFVFVEKKPEEVQVGRLPGLNYGFSRVTKADEIQERYISYMAFDGSQYLYIITTSFDPPAETGTFDSLADFETFEPYLRTIVAGLNLPDAN